MNPRGEDIASAVRDWVKDDLKKGPSTKHELGKFFTGISTGTLGLFATLFKFAVAQPKLECLTLACFAVLLISAAVALYMAIPNVVNITATMNLYDEYNRIIRSIVGLMALWFGLWLVGFSLGLIKLFL